MGVAIMNKTVSSPTEPDIKNNQSNLKLDQAVECIANISANLTEAEKATAINRSISLIKELQQVEAGLAQAKLIAKLQSINIPEAGRFVKGLLKPDEGVGFTKETIEPYYKEVSGEELFAEIKDVLNRFMLLPSEADLAITLWIMFAWVHNAFDYSPILNVWSPTKRCGKTRLLKVISRLVPNLLSTSNITPSAIFRSIELNEPTLLIDETDTFLGAYDEITGIINSGYERESAYVTRNEKIGDEFIPTRFKTWCPKVLAGIGNRKETIIDRSLSIHMMRISQHKKVERYSRQVHDEMDNINSKLQRWRNDNKDTLDDIYNTSLPNTPDCLNDRATDIWGILLTIAEHIGGDVPAMARKSAVTISYEEDESESIPVELLEHIIQVSKNHCWEEASGKDICQQLCQIEDAPWKEVSNGRSITPNKLAKMLKPFKVEPKQTWSSETGNRRLYQIKHVLEAYTPYHAQESARSDSSLKNKELQVFENARERGILAH
jgi:putative DNA primase/helicase